LVLTGIWHPTSRLSQENLDVVIIDRNPEKVRRVENTLDVQATGGGINCPFPPRADDPRRGKAGWKSA
jgi:hypothetical protein